MLSVANFSNASCSGHSAVSWVVGLRMAKRQARPSWSAPHFRLCTVWFSRSGLPIRGAGAHVDLTRAETAVRVDLAGALHVAGEREAATMHAERALSLALQIDFVRRWTRLRRLRQT